MTVTRQARPSGPLRLMADGRWGWVYQSGRAGVTGGLGEDGTRMTLIRRIGVDFLSVS
jgi:hypothetical protein